MKKFILILVAACTLVSVSAQTTQKKKISFDLEYKSEVSVGFAVTGKIHKTFYSVPGYGGGGDTGVGYVPSDSRADVYNGDVASVFSRPFVETIHGFQIGKYIFAGAGIGLQYYCGKLYDFQGFADIAAVLKEKNKVPTRWNAVAMPIFVDVRGMYPLKNELVPFINLGIGGTPIFGSAINYSQNQYSGGVHDKVSLRGGLYCDFGGGVRWKDYSLSIGLQHQTLKVAKTLKYEGVEDVAKTKMKTNAFYVKATYNF